MAAQQKGTNSPEKAGALKKEFQVSFELSEVLIFCGFYSSLVIFSLWITVTDKVGMLQKDIK